MMGTLATMLAGRGIFTSKENYQADVEGDIEDVSGVLKITQIRVTYTIAAHRDSFGEIQRVLATHLLNCPAAQSVSGCIQISHRAEIREREA